MASFLLHVPSEQRAISKRHAGGRICRPHGFCIVSPVICLRLVAASWHRSAVIDIGRGRAIGYRASLQVHARFVRGHGRPGCTCPAPAACNSTIVAPPGGTSVVCTSVIARGCNGAEIVDLIEDLSDQVEGRYEVRAPHAEEDPNRLTDLGLQRLLGRQASDRAVEDEVLRLLIQQFVDISALGAFVAELAGV